MSLKFEVVELKTEYRHTHAGPDIVRKLSNEVRSEYQKQFDDWLASHSLFYGVMVHGEFRHPTSKRSSIDTHTARLVDVKLIEKAHVHEPVCNAQTLQWKCWSCNKNLEPTGWREI